MAERSRGSIIITGASPGIGAATAIQAAASGYDVCINPDRGDDAAESVRDRIRAGGNRVISVAADVSNSAAVKMLFDRTEDELGPVTALVNDTGTVGAHNELTGTDEWRLERILGANVTGAFLCAREAVMRMSVANGGHGGAIVNVSSVAAGTGARHDCIDYALAKGVLDSMTASLALEAAPLGIRINTVRSGFILTDKGADGGDADRAERLENRIPLKRSGEPQEVARAILWLLSDEAGYAVGTTINVTGGI